MDFFAEIKFITGNRNSVNHSTITYWARLVSSGLWQILGAQQDSCPTCIILGEPARSKSGCLFSVRGMTAVKKPLNVDMTLVREKKRPSLRFHLKLSLPAEKGAATTKSVLEMSDQSWLSSLFHLLQIGWPKVAWTSGYVRGGEIVSKNASIWNIIKCHNQ